MEKIGIICEYNPFHNGHLYHIEEIKKLYPDSLIVLVMSGYFTERGDISLISKYNKTRIALLYGVDIVLELPTLYATNSADIFADSAIKALKECDVSKLIFGSESNDIKMLQNIAKMQIDNKELDIKIKEEMDKGQNYPTALSKALGTNLSSNDILGVAYIKAILKNNADIEPISIKRTNDFNNTRSNDQIISAQNIREKLKKNLDISSFIPNYPQEYINRIDEEKYFELLKYKIVTEKHLERYLGVDEGLENKIKKEIFNSNSLDSLIENIKSKRYTNVRLKRMLVHILLGIEKEDIKDDITSFKILGFNLKGQKYLRAIDHSNLIYKLENRSNEIEKQAAYVYKLLTNNNIDDEWLNKPIIVEKAEK